MQGFVFQRDFAPLYWTQFLGAFNDNIFKNALVILITYQAVELGGLGPSELVAFSAGLFILPFFVFSPWAGEMADRYERARLCRLIKQAEVVIMLLAALALWLESFAGLLGILFLMGAQSSFFGPLKYGMLPDTVGEERLALANAHTSAGTFVAILLGTLLGGTLAAVPDTWPLALALVGFAVAGLLSAREIQPLPVHTQSEASLGFRASFMRVWRMSYADRDLFYRLLGVSWFWFFGAVLLAMIPPLIKDVLRGDEWVSTFFLTLFTIGMGLGAALSQWLGRGRSEVGLSPIMGLLMSVCLFAFAWLTRAQEAGAEGAMRGAMEFLQSPEGVMAGLLMLGLTTAAGAYIVPLMTSVQERSPKAQLSRMIAANNLWNSLFMVAGSVLLMIGLALGMAQSSILIWLALANLVASFLVYAFLSPEALKLWARFLSFCFYRLKVEGKENFPKQGPYLIIANHVSFVDWLFLMAVCPEPIRFVIDYQYYYARGLPFWLRQARLIPIATRRERPEILERAFLRVERALDRGDVIGLFPEGALTRTGDRRRFQPGLQKILRRRPVPVVPVILEGLWGSFFSHADPGVFKPWRPRLKRREVSLRILPALEAEQALDIRFLEELYNKNTAT